MTSSVAKSSTTAHSLGAGDQEELAVEEEPLQTDAQGTFDEGALSDDIDEDDSQYETREPPYEFRRNDVKLPTGHKDFSKPTAAEDASGRSSVRKRFPKILTETERRINHSRSERRRRQQLKTALSVLEQLIPEYISIDLSNTSELGSEAYKYLTKEQIYAINANNSSPSTEATVINKAVVYIRKLTFEQMIIGTQLNLFYQRIYQQQFTSMQYQPVGTVMIPGQTNPQKSQCSSAPQLSAVPSFINHQFDTSTMMHPVASIDSMNAKPFVDFRNYSSYSTDTITIPMNNENNQVSRPNNAGNTLDGSVQCQGDPKVSSYVPTKKQKDLSQFFNDTFS